MNKQPNIFLSYSWHDRDIADIIQKDMGNVGIKLIRDTTNLKYKDDLKEFMGMVRSTDYSIILLSESYLKSTNCMFEAMELMKERNFIEKVLPIMIEDIKIFKPADQINFIKYWKNEKYLLEDQTKNLDIISSLNIFNQLKVVSQIYNSIDEFIKQITIFKLMNLNELKSEYYKSLLLRMNLLDPTIFQEIIRIDHLDNLNEQEIAVDNYIITYPLSTYGYELRGRISRYQGKFEKARMNYIRSIELDPNNWQALYNLGNLLDEDFKDHIEAVKYYRDAIVANPNLLEARVNLGYVYCYHLNDQEKAQEQYLEALKLNTNDGNTHQKIANSLRLQKPYDVEKIHYHFKKSIELDPHSYQAYLNYADFLRLINDMNRSEEYYSIGFSLLSNKGFK